MGDSCTAFSAYVAQIIRLFSVLALSLVFLLQNNLYHHSRDNLSVFVHLMLPHAK